MLLKQQRCYSSPQWHNICNFFHAHLLVELGTKLTEASDKVFITESATTAAWAFYLRLDTNITQNCLVNIFPEILKKMSKYPKKCSKYLEKSSKYLVFLF